MPKTVLSINRLLKKSFFLRPVHGLTRAKYYPQACLSPPAVGQGQTGLPEANRIVFEK